MHSYQVLTSRSKIILKSMRTDFNPQAITAVQWEKSKNLLRAAE